MTSSIAEMQFNITMSCISTFRYITDAISELPLGVISMVLNSKDMIVLFVNLLENAPWIRKNGKGLERFEGVEWVKITNDELQRLSKIEAQVWLALMNMLLDNECRRKYGYNQSNHCTVLKVRCD